MINKMSDEEKARVLREYKSKSARLRAIIRPVVESKYTVDHEWAYLIKNIEQMAGDYGGLDLIPDYQRGHVWSEDQQIHYIENALRGLVSESGFNIQFNCPNFDTNLDYVNNELPLGWQCIDGLQRFTAVKRFIDGEIRPFGLTVEDLACSEFMIKSKYRFRVSIFTFQTRAQLLQHYVDINAGGTPHSDKEIERVRGMLKSVSIC